jgi:uncharacterized protein (DUF1800 family)
LVSLVCGRATVAAVASLVLVGCGGGGGGGGSVPPDQAATSLAAKGSFDADDVAHLLNRTRFGPTSADLAAVQQQGVPAFVDAMLVLPQGTALETQVTADEIEDPAFPQEHELVRWWLRLMQENPNAFQEVLALFWHDHFATSQEILGGDKKHWWAGHLNLFRHGGAGNLRTLLLAVAQDWTMLEWLDGVRSTKNAPNENFAREFWELFTLGVDNGYTQADIVQAARCFTGFRTRYDEATEQSRVEFDANRHDTGAKTVLGQTVMGRTGAAGADEYRDMVDLTLAQRPVAEYVVGRLFAFFCYVDPPASVVAELASLLRAANYELAPVLATILKSEAFYSGASKAGLVKSPAEFALGFVRATGMRTHMDDLEWGLTDAGQRPTMPPNVNGWPGGTLWLSAQAMVERANLVRECVTHRGSDVQTGLDLRALLPAGAQTTATETVDALAALLHVALSPTDRTACVTYLDTQRQSNGTVVASPFSAANDVHVDERVRGLLYVLAQHPSYHVR